MKSIKELSEKIKSAELKGLVADLNIEMAEVKMRLAEALTENTELKAQLAKVAKPEFAPCPGCGRRTWRVAWLAR